MLTLFALPSWTLDLCWGFYCLRVSRERTKKIKNRNKQQIVTPQNTLTLQYIKSKMIYVNNFILSEYIITYNSQNKKIKNK